jgi:hypothetical protein
MKDFAYLTAIILWVTGIVLAKGFWSTLAAIILAPYSFYLVIERVISVYGLL